jgi:hypothetical protein
MALNRHYKLPGKCGTKAESYTTTILGSDGPHTLIQALKPDSCDTLLDALYLALPARTHGALTLQVLQRLFSAAPAPVVRCGGCQRPQRVTRLRRLSMLRRLTRLLFG